MKKNHKTVYHLMCRDVDDYTKTLTNELSKQEWTIEMLLDYTNVIDIVVDRWANAIKESLDEYPENIVADIYGALVVVRLLIDDLRILKTNKDADCISLLDGTQIITNLKQKMLPMAKSYARVPSLAQWYMTLPNEVDVVYRSIRRRLKDGS
jgi:CRISPR/Cas system-associated protein Cas10 (large subunit of type III CRISPR-Cas system)|tara:strand:- start:87 stop:542 length:456 start_codon:yes stop_codon:yes gene_type:complete